ncbi:MAG TPA: hypothetical protein VGR57_20035, partial [Ktedonobacterales bacterium]|nr:hypothetical protein [Ktedonobacterales bacterium]
SPIDRSEARVRADRHRDAQRLIGALVADAGFDVRLGLYLLPDAAYAFAATCAALASPLASSITDAGDQIQEGQQHA